jgi:hypothetical protein
MASSHEIFVNILCPSSGLGLKKDALIIQRALEIKKIQNKIIYIDFGAVPQNPLHKIIFKIKEKIAVVADRLKLLSGLRKGHVSVHLEVMMYKNVFMSPVNVLIPNQEWSEINPLICEKVNVIWCKSRLCETIFSEMGFPVRYIGFQTIINQQPDVNIERKREFFTRIGMTKTRGADQLVDLWSMHPEWPTLNMIIDESLQPKLSPANVKYIRPISSDQDYFALVNSFLFHIYVTEAEGFGHSIVESMSSGALVLVTCAAPMSEYASQENTILITAQYAGQMKLSPRFKSTNEQIKASIIQALSMDDSQITTMQYNAMQVNKLLEKNFVALISSAVKDAVEQPTMPRNAN